MERVDEVAARARVSVDADRPTPTVLIVDDEAAFAATLADILATKGYNAVVANTGAEGMDAAQHMPVDLALVDLKLPDVSGVEVLARIREISPRTEVIVLTGQAALDTALRALNLGAFGYLEKPYDIDRLFLLIERALARRARHSAEARTPEMSQLLDLSTVPMFAYYPDNGHITFANPAFARVLGLAGPEDMASSLAQLFRPDGKQSLADHLACLRARGRAVSDFSLRHNPGSETWYEITSSLVTRNPPLAFAVLTDVTSRRRIETESRQARQYFEAIFENLAAGVVIIDSNYEIQQANPAFARFYRATPGALNGRKCHEIIHHRLTPCAMHGEVCPINSCLTAGATVRVQHRHEDADRQSHYQECTMAPLHNESGTIVSFVAMFTDFTEIKQAQEDSEAKSRELETLNGELTVHQERLTAQAAELEQANAELIRLGAAKDDFVSLVSHELRTPLTAISEGISLVADGSLGPLLAPQTKFLNVAYRNCIRLGELINDLLDLSKIEAGRMDVRPERFDVIHVVNDIAETFTPLARDKGLTIQATHDDDCPPAFADERLARRCLTNLINNAVKFTDQGTIRVAAAVGDGEIRVSIIDTGIGIPASEQARIFERFHQVQQRDRNRPAGTGLGLALTRQMAEMNRGRVNFESVEGVGTTFTLTLPLDTTLGRVAAILSIAAREERPPTTAALVKLENAPEFSADHGTAGLDEVFAAIGTVAGRGPARLCYKVGLPQTGECLLLFELPDNDGRRLSELRETLAATAFSIRNTPTPVQLRVGMRSFRPPVDPASLLDKLRTEANDG